MAQQRRGVRAAGWAVAVLFAGGGAEVAHAGVPRACIHPHYDAIECARETRREHRDVLPSRRLRELDAQRPRLERIAPLEDVERNLLLRDLRDAVRYWPQRR